MLDETRSLSVSDRTPLKYRVLNAGAWSTAGQGFSLAVRFATNLLMTRLLVPEMFGVMAIANIVLVGLNMFSELGVRQSVIQSKHGDDPRFLNTAWVIQIFRGALLWLIGLCAAVTVSLADHHGFSPKGSVYADPQLPYVIAVVTF